MVDVVPNVEAPGWLRSPQRRQSAGLDPPGQTRAA